MTDYKALCAELLDEIPYESPLTCIARAALAQPEPEGPTGDELMDMAEFFIEDNGLLGLHNAGEFARAVLARWGCPPPGPKTDDSLTNYPKVTRVEVITSKGREFVRHNCAHVQFSLQDDGRTIKVFLSSND